MANTPLNDEEYDALKQAIIKKINQSNASEIFNKTKVTLLQKIITLDINDINQIEGFYLTGMELIRSGNFLLIDQKAREKNISFAKAAQSIGFDNTISLLLNFYKKNIHQDHFEKIRAIENKYKPGIQEWAQIHSYFLTLATGLAQETKALNLKAMIEEKKSFLKRKAEEFAKNGDMASFKAVNAFAKNIQKYTDQYLVDGNEVKFKRNMGTAIAQSRSILEQQEWWKDLIDDIANIFVNFFRKEPFNFTFFANPAKDELEELQMCTQPFLA